MSPKYPLVLDVQGRNALVVGGGPVAARRARSLVEAGARVEVVTPWACEELWELSAANKLRLTLREYVHGDVAGAWLVHAATGDRSVDSAIAEEANASRVWCVRADDASNSPAWTPAVARVDDVVVAVTSSTDPQRSVRIRDDITARLSAGEIGLRRVRRTGDGRGHVTLVGGGPGDPELITLRGLRALADADVVLVDRLAPRALLETLAPEVEVIDASKGRDAHLLSQDEINALLIEHARQGKQVVRLKGGDPFVFGRGGEEVLACSAAGIDVTVVPGVTSAIAVPGAAGVPVTHRGSSRQFTVVSAHEREAVDWAPLAALDGTLVILMGVARMGECADELIAHGRAGETPVAIIERGTLPDQRTTTATLATIAEVAAAVGVTSPAVIVVGDVVDVPAQVTNSLTSAQVR